MKILIAEDDFVCRTLIQELLKKYGECHAAADGQEAFDAYKKGLEADEPYDLICLDIMMPNMNGQDALKNIRAIEREKGIGGSDSVKVIMTTALDDAKNIMKALIKGSCDGYLNKPINAAQLDQKLNELGFKPLK